MKVHERLRLREVYTYAGLTMRLSVDSGGLWGRPSSCHRACQKEGYI
jgi:hypothetical protein